MSECDWRRLWPPEGVRKCDRSAAVVRDGYGGSPMVRFCTEHDPLDEVGGIKIRTDDRMPRGVVFMFTDEDNAMSATDQIRDLADQWDDMGEPVKLRRSTVYDLCELADALRNHHDRECWCHPCAVLARLDERGAP